MYSERDTCYGRKLSKKRPKTAEIEAGTINPVEWSGNFSLMCEHRPAGGRGGKSGPGRGDSQFRGPEAGPWQVCPSCNGETKMAGMKRAGGRMTASESTGWGRTLHLLLSGRQGDQWALSTGMM